MWEPSIGRRGNGGGSLMGLPSILVFFHTRMCRVSPVSDTCSPVFADTDVFWPAHFEVRVKHGEELNFQWGLNLRCVGTEGLGVTCGPSNSTDRCHFELRKAGTTAVAQSENHVLILEEAGGIGTFRVPGFSSVQPGGTIECCLENVGAGTEMCARSRVNVIASFSLKRQALVPPIYEQHLQFPELIL
eukprot:g24934.t1